MRNYVRSLMPVIFLACIVCSTQAQTPSAAAEISALLHAQADAWNKGDIVRKFADGWKIIHDHTSVTPAADPGSKKQ